MNESNRDDDPDDGLVDDFSVALEAHHAAASRTVLAEEGSEELTDSLHFTIDE